MLRYLRLLMVFVAFVGSIWTWYSRPQAGASRDLLQASTRVGAPAPAFFLPALDGHTVSLADMKGRVIVLNFWASWCPPCRIEMPALEQVHRDFADRGVVVLGVNQMESSSAASSFIQEQHLTFLIALDSDGAASTLYRVSALPSTYFIDKSGVIRDVIYGGPMTHALIESKVNALLSQ